MKLKTILLILCVIMCIIACNNSSNNQHENVSTQPKSIYTQPNNITVCVEKDVLRICPLTSGEFINELDSRGKYMKYISFSNPSDRSFVDLESLLKSVKNDSAIYIPSEPRHPRIKIVRNEQEIIIEPDTLNINNISTDCAIVYNYANGVKADTICLLTTAQDNIIRMNSHLAMTDSTTFNLARNCIWEIKSKLYEQVL